jgi:hypothetical protein
MLCDCSNEKMSICFKKRVHINRNGPPVTHQFQFRYVPPLCDPTELLGLRTESELVVVFVGLARRSGVHNRLVFVIVGRYVFREVGMNFVMLFR